MRVAIATDGENVAAHFGRCEGYTIVDIESEKATNQERLSNPGHEPGFLPQFLAERGVNCIVAGGMGPRAQMLFDEKNIDTIVGVQGSISETITALERGSLSGGETLCNH